MEIAPPQPQNRWSVFFRLILAVPAILLAGTLASSWRQPGYNSGFGLIGIAALLGWFVCLGRSRMPRGLRDAAAWALAYTAQLDAYLLLLTDRYPNSDPYAALDEVPVRSDPIQLQADENLHRSRLTVFFRLLLAIPHLIWLSLWGIAAFFAAIANWLATLVRGSSPEGLHRFLSSYVRYAIHVYAYVYLTADPFPGFTGQPGSYPVEVSIAGPCRQNRWRVGFRIVLAIPALAVASAYGGVACRGRRPWLVRGPRHRRDAARAAQRPDACAALQRPDLRLHLLLTEAYPYSGPSVNAVPTPSVPAMEPATPMPA